MPELIKNIVVISDTHCGCKLGLFPDEFVLDEGTVVRPSVLQKKVYAMWNEFWDKWIPQVTKGEDFILVHNGDAMDGVHHNSTTQVTHNTGDQIRLAKAILEPIVKNPKCKKYFQIRGTEAHVGQSGTYEEQLARELGAEKDERGNYARWELWLRFGKNKSLIHFTHHVGTTSSASYESTAVYKEYIESCTEAGRQGYEPPDVIVRSHRHRYFETRVSSKLGYGIAVVTPSWQLKTPFSYRIGLGRSSSPQIGGLIIKEGDEDPIYVRSKVWHIERDREVIV